MTEIALEIRGCFPPDVSSRRRQPRPAPQSEGTGRNPERKRAGPPIASWGCHNNDASAAQAGITCWVFMCLHLRSLRILLRLYRHECHVPGTWPRTPATPPQLLPRPSAQRSHPTLQFPFGVKVRPRRHARAGHRRCSWIPVVLLLDRHSPLQQQEQSQL